MKTAHVVMAVWLIFLGAGCTKGKKEMPADYRNADRPPAVYEDVAPTQAKKSRRLVEEDPPWRKGMKAPTQAPRPAGVMVPDSLAPNPTTQPRILR